MHIIFWMEICRPYQLCVFQQDAALIRPSSSLICVQLWLLFFPLTVKWPFKNHDTSIEAQHAQTTCFGETFIWNDYDFRRESSSSLFLSHALIQPRRFTPFTHEAVEHIENAAVKDKGAPLQRPAGPQALGSCKRVDVLLDPSGQAEHKRALPLHLAALPYPP